MRIELRSVSKRFGAQPVISGLSATLDFPHALALVGPSGGGKSSLLRLLAGLIVPDEGFLSVDGERLPVTERELRVYRSRLGVVFQSFNLFPHLSALENIRLPLVHVHGLPPRQASERARQVLARFRLEDHAGKRPSELSGGQRQRVAIARAVAPGSRFLLLDEPTSALDPEMTAEVLDLLTELRGEGRPLIFVTHEMGFARRAADLIGYVTRGTFAEASDPETFFTAPTHPEVQNFLSRVLRYE